ncbi:uncharacterized protein LOC117305558 [Asterias rubens]|uniref:uncharacterized protein LOC117305558 n=1 Tax=Asterias rubens TaxID=7604 RepID=UPI001455CC35|nr:uncharacterized protein LOC117305558 [Asterias rubens]
MNSLALLDPDRFLTSTAVDSNDGQDELLITQTQECEVSNTTLTGALRCLFTQRLAMNYCVLFQLRELCDYRATTCNWIALMSVHLSLITLTMNYCLVLPTQGSRHLQDVNEA